MSTIHGHANYAPSRVHICDLADFHLLMSSPSLPSASGLPSRVNAPLLAPIAQRAAVSVQSQEVDKQLVAQEQRMEARLNDFALFLSKFNNSTIGGLQERLQMFERGVGEKLARIESAEFVREQRVASRLDSFGDDLRDAITGAVTDGVKAALAEQEKEKDSSVSDAPLSTLSSRFDDVSTHNISLRQLQDTINSVEVRLCSLEDRVSSVSSTLAILVSSDRALERAIAELISQTTKQFAQYNEMLNQLGKVVHDSRDEAREGTQCLVGYIDLAYSRIDRAFKSQCRRTHAISSKLNVLTSALRDAETSNVDDDVMARRISIHAASFPRTKNAIVDRPLTSVASKAKEDFVPTNVDSMQTALSSSAGLESFSPVLDFSELDDTRHEDGPSSGNITATTLVNSPFSSNKGNLTTQLISPPPSVEKSVSPPADHPMKRKAEDQWAANTEPKKFKEAASLRIETGDLSQTLDPSLPPSPLTPLDEAEEEEDNDNDDDDESGDGQEIALNGSRSDSGLDSNSSSPAVPLGSLVNCTTEPTEVPVLKHNIVVHQKFKCPNTGCGRAYAHIESLNRHLYKLKGPCFRARPKASLTKSDAVASSSKPRIKLGVPSTQNQSFSVGEALESFMDRDLQKQSKRSLDTGVVASGSGSSKSLKKQGRPRKSVNTGNVPLHAAEMLASCEWPAKTAVDEVFDRQFIQCDGCDSYYHFRCVGVKHDDIRLNEGETFICAPCTLIDNSLHNKNIASTICRRPDCDWPGKASDEIKDFFVVEKILGRAYSTLPDPVSGDTVYLWLIKWQGYSMSRCEWVTSANMGDSARLIKQFYADAEKEKVDWSLDMVLLKSALKKVDEGARKKWRWVI
ncbi:hypothetical protein DFH11DRAFT_285026 [Phellopilus nigrolimitatus]|nr:hypothetical protein DFH11DRAFT_285026 [Phellopilus nigrolimitatus]